MSRTHSRDENKRSVKRRKLNDQCIELQSSEIFKLPVELLEYIFDYLPAKDLHSVTITCRWLQQVGIRCYQQNFSGVVSRFSFEEILRKANVYTPIGFECVELNPSRDKLIMKFIDKVEFNYLEDFEHFYNRNWKFQQLKRLILRNIDLRKVKVSLKRVQRLLHGLEDLHISFSDSGREKPAKYFENILSLTPNIKRLSLKHANISIREYPTLKRFEIVSDASFPVVSFLELNPNIRSFGMSSNHLWENRFAIEDSQIKLDDLAIYPNYWRSRPHYLISICHVLNQFHFQGLYKRLKLSISDSFEFNQEMVDELAKLNGLSDLFVGTQVRFFEHVTLSALKHLEEISVPDSRYIRDAESLVNSLEDLKRIHFGRATPDHVMLFISQHPKVTAMKVDFFLDSDENFNLHQILRLSTVNRERAKLRNVEKVILYVQEDVYLATKQARQETDFEFIKLQRLESQLWDNDFYFGHNEEDYTCLFLKTGKKIAWSKFGKKIEF